MKTLFFPSDFCFTALFLNEINESEKQLFYCGEAGVAEKPLRTFSQWNQELILRRSKFAERPEKQ